MKKHELKQLIKETILAELEATTPKQIYGITVDGEKIKLELDKDGVLLCSFDEWWYEDEDDPEDELPERAGNLKTLVVNDPRVTKIDCFGNQLTTLKLGILPKLEYLNCDSNQLTSLTSLKCPNLQILKCANNQLTTLDISKCPKLLSLNCANNQLTTLDISKCPNLNLLTYDKDKTQLIR